jgi:GT2 family glycosyltransferase
MVDTRGVRVLEQFAVAAAALLRCGVNYATRERFGPALSEDEASLDIASRELLLPSADAPEVSIILPVHGKFATTWTCLDSLSRVPAGASFEVIVADDCSLDRTREMLTRVRGIRVHRNVANLGYARTNNAAAKLARGKWLCLLNNDTRVTANWLGELVRTFEAFPNAAMVGAQLLFPDGRLQEAGAMVFRDGIASQYGRKRDPRRPEFSYARRVDYCSAACVLIERSIWERFGGFDELFAPAYYEDTDLAFRMRNAGFDVVYQPRCRIVHYEGVTHGRDLRRGPKAHQVVSHGRFVERWHEVLNREHFPEHRRNWQTAQRGAGPGLLVLTDAEPKAGTECHETLVAAQDAGWRTSVWAANAHGSEGATRSLLQAAGVEVLYPPYVTSLFRLVRSAPRGRFRAVLLWNRADANDIAARLRGWAPDMEILFDSVLASEDSGAPVNRESCVQSWRRIAGELTRTRRVS